MNQRKLPFSSILSTLIFLICTLSLSAQNEFIGLKKSFKNNTQKEILDRHFTEVEVYTLNVQSVNQYVSNASTNLEIRFKMGQEYDWNLNLIKRNIYSDNYISRVASENGIQVVEHSRPTTTFGYLRDGSGFVSLTFGENFIYGSIKRNDEEYFIEPASLFDPSANKNSFVLYNSDSVIPGNGTCGVTETAKHKPSKNLKSGNQSDCRIVELAHAADFSMYQSHGSDVTMTNNYIAGVINNVQLDYNQFGLEYLIVETFVHTTSATTNPWPTSNLTTSSVSAPDLLNEFRTWGNTGGFMNIFDLAQLWTDKDLDNGLPPADPDFSTGVVGLAGVNTTCNPGYSLIEDFSTNSTTMRVTVSHEFGHNFGCSHNYVIDDPTCDPGGNGPGRSPFIMDPVVSTATCWSDGTAVCDLNSTQTIETNILNFACLDGQVSSGKDIEATACFEDTNPIMLGDFLVLEDSGGTWSVNTGGLAPTTGFNNIGTFIPSGNVAGTYLFDYTISGTDLNPVNCTAVGSNPVGHCATTTTLTVNLIDLGAGTPDATVPLLCNTTSSPFNLMSELVGSTAGGTWTVNPTSPTPTMGFNSAAGTFDPLSNPIGTYLFDYSQAGTFIPGAAALQCTANEASTDGAIFGPGTYGAISTPTIAGCTPDTRVTDCTTFRLEIDVTAYDGPTGQLQISIRPPGCGPSILSVLRPGVGTYLFTELDLPIGFDPSGGFCVVLFDNLQDVATDIDFVADVVIDYPAVPDTGCPDMMSTVTVNVDTCIPPPNDNCASAIYLQCADAVTVSTTFASDETLPDCAFGGTLDNFSKTSWYRFTGTGETFQITACNSINDYGQEIHVYSGSCGALNCLVGDGNSCPNGLPELTFTSTSGIEYFVMVGSYGSGISGGSVTLEFNCGNCIDRSDIILTPPNDFLNGDMYKIETNQNIIADNILKAGSDIIYDGKQSILMNPEFEVELGATYLAVPDGCGGVFFEEEQVDKK